jgi:hypothetical protein
MKKVLPIAVLCLLLFASCKKSSEDLQMTPISDYAPLTVGKYINYAVDSLLYTSFGNTETHHFYDVKLEVSGTLTDNLGRQAFRITHYIKPQGSGTFTPDNTFMAVNTGNGYEFTENNLRYLKLVLPIKDGITWKGNSYIYATAPAPPGQSLAYLDDWDYFYENTGLTATVNGVAFPNTVTVNERDLSEGLPVGPLTTYAQRDFSKAIYAKGIGMIYREFLHFEYQQNTTSYTGYGVKYTMTDHN